MYYPDLFRNINSEHTLARKILIKDHKTNKSEKDNKEDLNRLLKFMEAEEPYLDATITLQKLADKIEMSNREVSILINQNLNQHFFDFINQLRIKKAQKILSNSKNNQLTVQQIMYDVGFNSKSSFYTAFKKQTGLTPLEYRKSKPDS